MSCRSRGIIFRHKSRRDAIGIVGRGTVHGPMAKMIAAFASGRRDVGLAGFFFGSGTCPGGLGGMFFGRGWSPDGVGEVFLGPGRLPVGVAKW